MHALEEAQDTPVAATPPKEKVVMPGAGSKPDPVNMTVVPPVAGPDVGDIDVSDAGIRYANVDEPEAATPSTVAVTVTVPLPAGDVPVQVVPLVQLTPVAAAPPKLKVVVPGATSKPLPEKVTVVPPAAGPEVGEIELSVAQVLQADPYVNWSAVLVALVPSAVVTVMSTVALPLGATALSWLAESTDTEVAGVEPKLTAAPGVKSVPETLTTVPDEPKLGLIPLTVGAEKVSRAAYVAQSHPVSPLALDPAAANSAATQTSVGF